MCVCALRFPVCWVKLSWRAADLRWCLLGSLCRASSHTTPPPAPGASFPEGSWQESKRRYDKGRRACVRLSIDSHFSFWLCVCVSSTGVFLPLHGWQRGAGGHGCEDIQIGIPPEVTRQTSELAISFGAGKRIHAGLQQENKSSGLAPSPTPVWA